MKHFFLSSIAGVLGGAIATLATNFFQPGPVAEDPAAPSRASAPPRPLRPAAPSGDEIFRSVAQFAAAAGAKSEWADAPTTTEPAPTWQAQINALIDSLPPKESVRRIAALLPCLPPEAQEEAAWRVDTMIFAEDYQIAAAVLRNPGTTPQAWNVLFEGLQRRPDSIRLPLLADLAATHPLGESARAELRNFFGYNPSQNPPSWHELVSHHFALSNDAEAVE